MALLGGPAAGGEASRQSMAASQLAGELQAAQAQLLRRWRSARPMRPTASGGRMAEQVSRRG